MRSHNTTISLSHTNTQSHSQRIFPSAEFHSALYAHINRHTSPPQSLSSVSLATRSSVCKSFDDRRFLFNYFFFFFSPPSSFPFTNFWASRSSANCEVSVNLLVSLQQANLISDLHSLTGEREKERGRRECDEEVRGEKRRDIDRRNQSYS